MALSNEVSGALQSSVVGQGNGFGSTAWSVVLAAAKDTGGGAALDRLCRRYWRPAYTFARRSGLPRWDAEDATQDFFSHLFAGEWLKQADPDRGSFRAFLLTLMRNFLSNRRRHDHAQKRGGGQPPLSINTDECERELAALAAADDDPARAYERAWANCVLQAALERLAEEQTSPVALARFEVLRPYLTQTPAAGDYERLGQTLGLSRNQIAVNIHRHSRRFAELIRSEVADTLVDRAALDLELRRLLEAMAA
jgi:RNA polymerase sigma-70 factor (ECF subfamily)